MRRAITLLRSASASSSSANSAAISTSATAAASLSVRNTQRTIPLNLPLLHSRTSSVLRCLRLSDYSLDVWVTTDASIRKLNREYRSQDKPTDILSFPFQSLQPPSSESDPLLRSLPPPCPHSGVRELGQMVISAPYVNRAAIQLEQSVDDRLRTLIVHGICHLLGYDHEQPEESKIMEVEEARIMAILDQQEAAEFEEMKAKKELKALKKVTKKT